MARIQLLTYFKWTDLKLFYIPSETEILYLFLVHCSNVIIKKAFLMSKCPCIIKPILTFPFQ